MICKTVRKLFDRAHLSFGNRPHPPAPSPTPLVPPFRGMTAEASPFCLTEKGGKIEVPLPELGEGFRVRATKVRCSLPTRTRILVSINLRLI
jgi:hypothetical protein